MKYKQLLKPIATLYTAAVLGLGCGHSDAELETAREVARKTGYSEGYNTAQEKCKSIVESRANEMYQTRFKEECTVGRRVDDAVGKAGEAYDRAKGYVQKGIDNPQGVIDDAEKIVDDVGRKVGPKVKDATNKIKGYIDDLF